MLVSRTPSKVVTAAPAREHLSGTTAKGKDAVVPPINGKADGAKRKAVMLRPRKTLLTTLPDFAVWNGDVEKFLAALPKEPTRLTGIGRAGERLTIAHERERTGHEPKWISVESNEDGYDVLSVAGRSDARLLSIEVKATTVGTGGSFHLTANEWDRAVFNDIHAFHLWDISRPVPSLAVLAKTEVAPHVPDNRGNGAWESVEIPFGAFSGMFLAQPNLSVIRVD